MRTPGLTDIERAAIIIQARVSASRFPGKTMSFLAGMPLVEYVYRRCQGIGIKKVLIATSEDKSDDILYDYCRQKAMPVTRGSLQSVLERYIQAAEWIKADTIARVCADTPFVDTSLIRLMLETLISHNLDYVSVHRERCASAFFSEVIGLKALKISAASTRDAADFEHVTRFILQNRNKFSLKFLDTDLNPDFIKDIRLTIDYPQDLALAGAVIAQLEDKFRFTSEQILSIIKERGLSLCAE